MITKKSSNKGSPVGSRRGCPNKTCYGEKHHSAKLTEDDVRLIDALLNESLSLRKIAEKFDVSHQVIWAISTGRTWNHITGIRKY
jgi:hypothetical protein